MNLKEAFRYQNYLSSLVNSLSSYLSCRNHLVRVQQCHLRKNANPDAQDEVIDATTERPYEQDNGTIIQFMKAVMDEKYSLSLAINKAKAGCSIDVDAATSANLLRRNMASSLESICAIKPSEKKLQGSDFKFNANGEQVCYYYDIKETTTIDFDRAAAKRLAKSPTKEADEVSAALDRAMLDVAVIFYPSFNLSDSVADALEAFATQQKLEKHAL